MTYIEKDQKHIWHPFTQEKTAEQVICIARGEGSYIYDDQGKGYLDLVSSWWCNIHGHSNPEIAKAIYSQATTLEHVMFAGFTHKPAITLATKLAAHLPSELSRFFFSDNGSTAVEAAVKIAYQYWQNKGQSARQLFLCFEGGYHGDTFGAMSVGDSHYHRTFKKLHFPVHTVPFPETWEDDPLVEGKEAIALTALKIFLQNHVHETVAFIAEPLIQGASGMRFCRPEFLQNLVDILKDAGILVIFDEVMTGFYRTGSFFAMNQIQRAPDILCLSKGLTGGFLPLALTVVNQHIYEAFLDDSVEKAFLHGHTYTANPLGCAAAIASLNLLEKESTLKKIKSLRLWQKELLSKLSLNTKEIEKPRVLGTIAAFDLKTNNLEFIKSLKTSLLNEGFLIRSLGKTIYILPPYCIEEDDLVRAYEALDKNIRRPLVLRASWS